GRRSGRGGGCLGGSAIRAPRRRGGGWPACSGNLRRGASLQHDQGQDARRRSGQGPEGGFVSEADTYPSVGDLTLGRFAMQKSIVTRRTFLSATTATALSGL